MSVVHHPLCIVGSGARKFVKTGLFIDDPSVPVLFVGVVRG